MTSLVRYVANGGSDVQIGVVSDTTVTALPDVGSIAELLRLDAAEFRRVVEDVASADCDFSEVSEVRFLPPIDGLTPVWAAGVTYLASRQARVEESEGGDVYERVYDAARPELFFKAQAYEVTTSGEPVGRRRDSSNDTPEPELALFLNRHAEIVGFGACNDMSSRSIEGENPLYLPQAKIFAGCCALAPMMRVAWEVEDPTDLEVSLRITRNGTETFKGTTSTRLLKRSLSELGEALFAAQPFPDGVVLSTGTCLVPPLDAPVRDGDVIEMGVEHVARMCTEVVPSERLVAWISARASDPTVRYSP